MKIRSITCFVNPGWPLDESLLQRCGDFIAAAKTAYSDLGYEVQTARLATIPFPQLVSVGKGVGLVELAVTLEQTARSMGLEYISLGPALPDNLESYAAIPAAIAATQTVFMSGLMTTPGGGVSLPAVHRCAEVIQQVAPITPDGFANLRFAALANVMPGVPFFPAAYHAPTGISFALALESADLAVEAVSTATSLAMARQTLIQTVEEHAARLAGRSQTLASQFGVSFGGLDFTPASFPQEEQSFGAAIAAPGCVCCWSAWFPGCRCVLDRYDGSRRLSPGRFQRVVPFGFGGLHPGLLRCRRHLVSQRPVALLSSLRHRVGYHPLARRYHR